MKFIVDIEASNLLGTALDYTEMPFKLKDVHLYVVCHINRTDSHQFLPPKGKEGEPFWVNVRKESARGSASLEQLSWNIILLEPEILPDFSRGRVRFKVGKTRFGDSLGVADVFTLDPDTWEVVLDTTEDNHGF